MTHRVLCSGDVRKAEEVTKKPREQKWKTRQLVHRQKKTLQAEHVQVSCRAQGPFY